MRVILVLGAGRSSSSLISYLLREGERNNWEIIVGDFAEQAARERIGNASIGKAIQFDIGDEAKSRAALTQAHLVISLMPPHLHIMVAKLCLELNKHLLTASYVSEEMQSLDTEARAKGLLFLNECGLDPGIDHMSAMQIIDRIKEKYGTLNSFESFTGGLILPASDPENPWGYKFTWNPRNVITAGQSTAKFLQEGAYKYIPYQQLFKRSVPVHVKDHGEYEGYANRDSLKYIDTYGLQGIKTMIRGTLRHKGFCDAWNIFVQLGCCDDTYMMEGVSTMTHRDFLNAFLDVDMHKSVEDKIANTLNLNIHGPELQKLKWSGFFQDELIGLESGTPAQILEHILTKKWKLNPGNKDLIVMWHRFVYEVNGIQKQIQTSLVVHGEDATNTAMAKTVGLPLGIAAKLLLQGTIKQRGVIIPIHKEIYEPLLKELKMLGVVFKEEES